MDQGSRVRGLPYPGRTPCLARRASRTRSEPDRVHHALDGVVDLDVAADYAIGDAATTFDQSQLAVEIAAYAWIVRVFLCLSALLHIHLAGPVLRPHQYR